VARALLTLPATRTKASSIIGFLRLDNQNEMYEFEDSLNSELFIKTIDNFIEQRVCYKSVCKTVICLDNYSVHKARIVQEKQKEWEAKNVFLYYLAPYCSELNPIEILWRFLKHKWLAPKDYKDKDTLQEAVTNILQKFGEEYKINFKL
jgi:transposase